MSMPAATPLPNRILDIEFSPNACGELIKPVAPKVPLEEIKLDRRFQFAGDRNTVRQVIDYEGEYVLLRTLGDSSEPEFYKAHYSYLKKNETELEYLK